MLLRRTFFHRLYSIIRIIHHVIRVDRNECHPLGLEFPREPYETILVSLGIWTMIAGERNHHELRFAERIERVGFSIGPW